MITGRRSIAEDITQEVFLRCFKYISKLRVPETFQKWLYRIIVTVSWQMNAKENTISLEAIDDPENETLEDDSRPDEIAETKETDAIVYAAIRELSLPLRTALILFYYNGLSIKEIAAVSGCLEGTVKSRLHNAKKILGEKLAMLDRS
jgi:RNA polymerase sigma-70 factor (ECF subfamily)